MPLSSSQLAKAASHLERGDWQAAHEIVQKDEDSVLACWAHGIVHIMEGDIPNARYWYDRASRVFPVKPDSTVETRELQKALKS
jgi:hypothetical protein